MSRQIFVNLPVSDLNASMEFFRELGFDFNPQFTDEKAACMIIGDNIFSMLLTRPFFESFTKKEIADTSKDVEVMVAMSADSREAVDKMVDRALELGGRLGNATQDLGWMYNRSFEDLDGHTWEVAFMDITKFPK